jgi:hypothetical protein
VLLALSLSLSLAILGGAIAYAYFAATNSVSARPATEDVHVFGTWHGALPLLRGVRRSPVPLVGHMYGREIPAIAHYDPYDQSITLGPALRGLPAITQATALRHEYGHALLVDILNRDAMGSYALSRFRSDAVLQLAAWQSPGELPRVLRPIWSDFVAAHRSNPAIYGDWGAPAGYYTSTFGEFFAESFAAYCVGNPEVPAGTAAALTEIEQLEP